MVELLSLADHKFITEAKNIFIAVNTSQSGEISFEELRVFLDTYSTLERTHNDVKSLFRKFHHLCDNAEENQHDSISWSEWLVLIAAKTQLNRKNLLKLFEFLNYKATVSAMSLNAIEKAYRPHIFRLKLNHGEEK